MSSFKRYVTSRATQHLCHHLENHDFDSAATFFEVPLPIYAGDDRIIAANDQQLLHLLHTFQQAAEARGADAGLRFLDVSEPRPNRFSVVVEQSRSSARGTEKTRATLWMRLTGEELRIELISSDSLAALGAEVETALRQL